jgi:CheY-like chemotaxis protein
LTGSQARGDAYVHATLEALLQSPAAARGLAPRVALYRVFHLLWTGTHKPSGPAIGKKANRTHLAARLGNLSLTRREALLLTVMESFDVRDVAAILDLDEGEVGRLVDDGVGDLVAPVPASILIIEDEPLISMDLAQIVEDMGHSVSAIATTRAQALDAYREASPDLILADVQLADGSSGVDAVEAILSEVSVPVVFITAHAERLLTGDRKEPVFLVTKPFVTRTVKAAIGQALLMAEEMRDDETYTRSAAAGTTHAPRP